MPQSYLRDLRVIDNILTKVVLGYNLEQQFTGQHLFPDISVPQMGGKILKFGKEAYIVRNTVRAPGETVRDIGFAYSSDNYTLENRLLEGKVPEEFVAEMAKGPGLKAQTEAVNIVMQTMRLEGEANKAKLATSTSAYATGHTEALSGTDQWDNAASDPLAAISDAKAKIRKSTGQYPNVLHLDVYAYEALKRHPKIIEHFKYTGAASITTAMLATYFDIETVVVAKAVSVASLEADFTELWGNQHHPCLRCTCLTALHARAVLWLQLRAQRLAARRKRLLREQRPLLALPGAFCRSGGRHQQRRGLPLHQHRHH